MEDKAHKPLAKIRTFQLDQAYARGEEPIVTAQATPKQPLPVNHPAPKIVVTTKSTAAITAKAPGTNPSATIPTAPPSFHELKKNTVKKIEHIIAEETKPAPKTVIVRKNEPTSLPRSFSTTATVITSAKINEFHFFPALATAFKNWWQGFRIKNDPPKYTVTAAEHRRGVIQKATTSSGATFSTDINTLKQELTRKREYIPDNAPSPLHLAWSPQTEPGFPLIEGPDQLVPLPTNHSVVVEYKKRTQPISQMVSAVKPNPVSQKVFTPPKVNPLESDSRWEADSNFTTDSLHSTINPDTQKIPTPVPVFKIPEPVAAPANVVLTPTVTEQRSTVPVLHITKPGTSIPNKPNPRSSYLHNGLRQLFRFDTTVATVVVVGSLLSFVMMFFIVKTFLGIINTNTAVPENVISIAKPLSPNGKVIDLAVSAISKEAIFNALANESRSVNDVTEFRILTADGTVIPGNTLWDTFGFSSSPQLSRSIKEAHLAYAEGDSAIILSISDAVTVFGSLLTWETNMGIEVGTWFDANITGASTFTDETIGDSDVRILKLDNQEVIVYGFIDSNTVVITESVAAYKATLGSD